MAEITGALFATLAVVVAVVGWQVRRRLRHQRSGGVTDDIMRQIETSGSVEIDDVEPVDLDLARSEEDEFWAQTWDEPEEL